MFSLPIYYKKEVSCISRSVSNMCLNGVVVVCFYKISCFPNRLGF